MPRNPEELLIEALQLPKQERAELAGVLLRSIDDQVDEGVDEAWEAEIAKRLKEIDEGKVEMIPGDVALKQMRERIEHFRDIRLRDSPRSAG